MTDIDWKAVEWVINGSSMKLKPAEKRAVLRRLDAKMRTEASMYGAGLSAEDVASRLRTSRRHVERLRAELPPAVQKLCPVCRDVMWVSAGHVEPHPDRLYNDCPMSGERVRTGLAAMRPDLYEWVVAV